MLNTIFLIGYMGAGKSVVGRLLSQINGSIALKDSFLGGLEVKIEIENK